MATRQYIGARYVPRFYENSLGTSEWEPGVIYEPLTVVTYNNNSYTSKKLVPANIGDPGNNPFYWVATGNFNAQINEMMNEINTFEQSVNDKLSKFVNVVNFGAVGDGVTDDTDAIQAAIDEAEQSGSTLFIPAGVYKTSTLWISKTPLHIMGAGTLKGYPIRYDAITANVTAGSTQIEVADGSIYRKNMVLTLADVNTEVLVVTGITGNVLDVATFRYYDGNTSDPTIKNNYPSGAKIHINSVLMVCDASIMTTSPDPDISVFKFDGLYIDGVHFEGSRSGYDNNNYSVYDITLNGGVFIYRGKNVILNACTFSDFYNNAINVLGRSESVSITGCRFKNVYVPAPITTSTLKDCAAAICVHWDQRYSNSSEICKGLTISGNTITNCFHGIFLSSPENGSVTNNNIRGCTSTGITLYTGDNNYGIRNIEVTGNSIERISGETGVTGTCISLNGASFCSCVGNGLRTSERGVFATISNYIDIVGNTMISNSDANILIGRMSGNIANNILTCGSGCRANVEINNDTGINIDILTFQSNMHNGYNTENAAYNVIAGEHLYFNTEFCNIRNLLKLAAAISLSDDIFVSHCIMKVNNGQVAATQAERDKILQVDNFIGAYNTIQSSEIYQAKTSADIGALYGMKTGMLLYDTTNSALKVYNGSAWVNV